MIVTDRLRLPAWDDSHRQPAALMNADPEVMRWFPATMSRAETDAQIDRQIDRLARRGFTFWPVIRRSDEAFLGLAGLKEGAPDTPVEGVIEIGWRFAAHAWGQGYASEAARAALVHGFADPAVVRIGAITAAGNTASWALMERLGMTRDPAGDFAHPLVPPGHRACQHITYFIQRDGFQP